MNPTSKVSACMVLYHSNISALTTARCVMNSDIPIQLFLVDNSPKVSAASNITEVWPEVELIRSERNLGYGRGNNLALPKLKSQYHLILNPDVTFEADLVSRMVRYMEAHRDIVLLTPKVLNPDGSEQALPRLKPSLPYLLSGVLGGFSSHFRQLRQEYTLTEAPVETPMEVQCATGCFMLIRTHIFYRLGGFDPRYFLYMEDCDLTLKALRLGRVVYHPEFTVTHGWNRADRRSPRLALAHIHSALQFFHKWGW